MCCLSRSFSAVTTCQQGCCQCSCVDDWIKNLSAICFIWNSFRQSWFDFTPSLYWFEWRFWLIVFPNNRGKKKQILSVLTHHYIPVLDVTEQAGGATAYLCLCLVIPAWGEVCLPDNRTNSDERWTLRSEERTQHSSHQSMEKPRGCRLGRAPPLPTAKWCDKPRQTCCCCKNNPISSLSELWNQQSCLHLTPVKAAVIGLLSKLAVFFSLEPKSCVLFTQIILITTFNSVKFKKKRKKRRRRKEKVDEVVGNGSAPRQVRTRPTQSCVCKCSTVPLVKTLSSSH